MGSLDGKLHLDHEAAAHTNVDAVIGRRIVMAHDGVAGSFAPRRTQLISARVRRGQWLVTMMQAVRGSSGVTPWVSTFDGGTAYPPLAPAIFTAPTMPFAGGADGVLQVQLRWGAGGTTFETRFDYPVAGAVFGVVADQVDINVDFRVPPTTTYATEDLIPTIGAFMVEGQAADPTPMRWLEPLTAVSNANPVFFGVKPYARKLRVAANPTEAGKTMQVTWLDTRGLQLYADVISEDGSANLLDVPAQATVVKFTDGGVNPKDVLLEWHIGLT